MIKRHKYQSLFLLIIVFFSISFYSSNKEKINGICFVAPPHKVNATHINPIKAVNASWVAVTPYAFCRPNSPNVTFNQSRQWRGETEIGTIETIIAAKKLGLKVMMKPHIWVMGQGWAGAYDMQNETDWVKWEKAYSKYIMRFAEISDSLNVEIICIGTEFKNAVKKRPQFWATLIDQVRKSYHGKVTYAANWDNYDNVTFWNKLDYIGIDAYFPICDSETPTVQELNEKWKPVVQKLQAFQSKYKKPILFTEFGYRSMDFSAAGHWEMDNKNGEVNLEAQKNATEAIFNTFWKQDWFAGGFLWKWHSNHEQKGGINDSHYTPQNKPAELIVKQWYNEH
jgi:hypothetical protein